MRQRIHAAWRSSQCAKSPPRLALTDRATATKREADVPAPAADVGEGRPHRSRWHATPGSQKSPQRWRRRAPVRSTRHFAPQRRAAARGVAQRRRRRSTPCRDIGAGRCARGSPDPRISPRRVSSRSRSPGPTVSHVTARRRRARRGRGRSQRALRERRPRLPCWGPSELGRMMRLTVAATMMPRQTSVTRPVAM